MNANPASPTSNTVSGIFLLEKPAGVTSFDATWFARRCLGATKAGHCGTLDPAARGLLIILFGKATRLQDQFHALEKEYSYTARLGSRTDTGDAQGKVVEELPFDGVTEDALKHAQDSFRGAIAQLPPMYSALKYKGKAYHQYARRGIPIPRTPRTVEIHDIQLTSFQSPHWSGRVICSRGTYVRTLVEDIAAKVGTVAHLTDLTRTRIGQHRLEQALPWAALKTTPIEALRASLLNA